MKFVSAREANQAFSSLLGQVEAGEEVVITRRGKPVAVLGAYRETVAMTPERQAAVARALAVLDEAPRLGTARRFTRDEMHER